MEHIITQYSDEDIMLLEAEYPDNDNKFELNQIITHNLPTINSFKPTKSKNDMDNARKKALSNYYTRYTSK